MTLIKQRRGTTGRALATVLLFTSLLVAAPASMAGAQGLAEVSVSDITITELNGAPPVAYRNAIVTFTVTGPRNGSSTIDYALFDTGSATADVDYRDFSQTVFFGQGQSTVTRAIRVYGDTVPEPTETFEIRLSNPVNATIDDGVGVITIIDNDGYVPPAGPAVSVADTTVTEGDDPSVVNLSLTLSEPMPNPVTVDLATSNGSAVAGIDYNGFVGTITFPANQTSVQQPIGIIGDTAVEGTETFDVTLSNPSEGLTIADGTATVTITDDDDSDDPDDDPDNPDDDPVCADGPYVSVDDVTVTETNGTRNFLVTFRRSSTTPTNQSTRFYARTVEGTATEANDFMPRAGQLVVINGINTLTKTLAFKIKGDTTPEPTESYTIELFNPLRACIDPGNNSGTVTIVDNDGPSAQPTLSVANASTTETNGSSTVDVAISLDQPAAGNVTVQVDTADGSATAGSDYVALSATTATIPAGGTTTTVPVTILGDSDAEPTEDFTITLSNPTGATLGDSSGKVTILDDESPLPCDAGPEVTISDVTVVETEFELNAIVAFTRSEVTATSTRIRVDTVDQSAVAPGDYTPRINQLVVIKAGQTVKTLAFKIQGDTIAEPTETFLIQVTDVVRGCVDPDDDSGTVTILDNDSSPLVPVVSVTDITTTETDNPSTVNATITLNSPAPNPVTVTLTTTDGTATAGNDYLGQSTTLTIPTGQTTTTATLSIIGDNTFEPTETFTINLTNPINATIGNATATITILDNDSPPPPPIVSVTDITTTETDNPSTVNATITLNSPAPNPVTVTLTTTDGTATAGNDYLGQSTTLTIPTGQTTTTATLSIIGDNTFEPTETFTINLTNPINATIGNATATITILDNDELEVDGFVDVRVSNGNDDVEEAVGTGSMYRTSSDLELTTDGNTQQLVGIRFRNVTVPEGAVITSAWIEFEVDEVSTGPASLSISGERIADASGFSSSAGDVSARTLTNSVVPWAPGEWLTVDEEHQTPSLSSVVQEIVSLEGWQLGNSMAFIVSGTGRRTAEAYNGDAANAPRLYIEYSGGDPVTPPPALPASGAWPGSGTVADLTQVDGDDWSGATYDQTAGTAGVLWLVNNGGSTDKIARITRSNSSWSSTADLWDLGGGLDTEAITVGPGAANTAYLGIERVGGATDNRVVRVNTSNPDDAAVTKTWDLSELDGVPNNQGIEGLTWIPDADLASLNGYVPGSHGNHQGGLFVLAQESGSLLRFYALDHSAANNATQVYTVSSGLIAVMGLEYDESQKVLYATCDNGCGSNRVAALWLNPNTGTFELLRTYGAPSGHSGYNNEGFALLPVADCNSGNRPAIWTDDSENGGVAVREVTFSGGC